MAIDTRMKRFSMLNMATVHVYPVLFEADSAVDADDRAFLLHLYGGNALSAPAFVGVPAAAAIPSRRTQRPAIIVPTTIGEPLRRLITQIIDSMEHHQLKTVVAVPTTATLKEGERILYHDGTNLFIYSNRNGTLYRIQWSAV